jgi:hypothetical protein
MLNFAVGWCDIDFIATLLEQFRAQAKLSDFPKSTPLLSLLAYCCYHNQEYTRAAEFYEILIELCKINAPLNKIHHYKANKEIITGNKKTDVYYGAGKNHIDVVKHFIQNNYNNCLILEDDVTFTSNITMHKKDLKIFLEYKAICNVII